MTLPKKSESAKRGHSEAAAAFVTYDGAAHDLNELARYVDRLEAYATKVRDEALAQGHGQFNVAVALLAECVGPLEVLSAVEVAEDDGGALDDLVAQIRKFVADARNLKGTP